MSFDIVGLGLGLGLVNDRAPRNKVMNQLFKCDLKAIRRNRIVGRLVADIVIWSIDQIKWE